MIIRKRNLILIPVQKCASATSEEDYLNAVRRNRSIIDSVIAKALNVSRSYIRTYRLSNPEIEEKAKNILDELSKIEYRKMPYARAQHNRKSDLNHL